MISSVSDDLPAPPVPVMPITGTTRAAVRQRLELVAAVLVERAVLQRR